MRGDHSTFREYLNHLLKFSKERQENPTRELATTASLSDAVKLA